MSTSTQKSALFGTYEDAYAFVRECSNKHYVSGTIYVDSWGKLISIEILYKLND